MRAHRDLTAREIASLVGGELEGPDDVRLAGVAPLDRARPGELSLLASSRYLPYFQRTNAGAVLLTPVFRAVSGGPATRIVVEDPRAAIQRLAREWYAPTEPAWGLHSTATVAPGARWQGRISLGQGAVIEAGATLGTDCVIGAFAVVGAQARLGDGCRVGMHAAIAAGTVIGNRVTLKAGARVGGGGFGFVSAAGSHEPVTHVGQCVLEDDVEVGANCTIDRGSFGDTVIGAGTKIDSLVHVAHNVRIGRHCLIMAQVGIAGSTEIEDDVILAGQAGLADHLRIGRGARVAAQGGVVGDVPPGATVSGYPARSHREVLRQAAALKRLAPLVQRLEDLAREHPDGD